MTAPIYSVADFRTALLNMLPRGRIWSRDPDAMPWRLAEVWAPTFQRAAQAAGNLIADAFPGSTVTLLPEWEATLGLPDPCAGEGATIELRRNQVVARLTDNGGASVPYFIQFAAALGYAITITQFAPARFGMARFGTRYYGRSWAYVWQVNAPAVTVSSARFGAAQFGDRYRTWGNLVLECEIKARAPAHTTVLFNYSGER